MTSNANRSSFESFIDTVMPPHPCTLPLVHVTQSICALEILRAGAIQATECKEFNELLAYFFYGAARYRSKSRDPGAVHAWWPIAFAIKLDDTKLNIKRIFPFDSGAFKGGLYSEFFHPAMLIEDFAISASALMASKCVQKIYGNNKNYLAERTLEDLKYPPTDFHIDSYLKLIRSAKPDKLDNRRSAIELQIGTEVRLSDHQVVAVVVPELYLDDDEFVSLVESVCKVRPTPYDTGKTPSDFQFGALSQVVGQLIKQQAVK